MKKSKLFELGIFLVLFIFLNIFLSSALFVFKVSITKYNFIISFIISLAFYVVITLIKNKKEFKNYLKYYVLFCLLILGSIFISSKMYDVSYDGNAYHKTAVGELKNGWNPVYESIVDFNVSKNNSLKLNNDFDLWNDHYAKGYWIYAANVYKTTGNIEAGKSMILITAIATFFICLSVAKCYTSTLYATIVSLLLAFNPILLYQMSTYYNDALLGNYLIILIATFIAMSLNKEELPKSLTLLSLLLTLCVLINIKFTGFVYAGIYSLGYYIYFLFNKKQRSINLKGVTITAVVSLVLGLVVIGYSTYIKNYIDHGHPFYPLYGEGKVDIMYNNTPVGFEKMNRFKSFLVSNFSYTYNAGNYGEAQYKIKVPFTFTLSELNEFRFSDVRVAGYGVLFGGILIVTFIIGVYSLIIAIKNKENVIELLIPIFATLFIIVILKESWWARYIPQLYLMPFLAIAILNKVKSNKVSKLLTNFVLIVLFLNAYLVFNPAMEEIVAQKRNIEEAFKVVENTDAPVYVYTSEFDGSIFNVYDRNHNIIVVDTNDDIEGYNRINVMGSMVRTYAFVKENNNEEVR